jgi:iron complex transport system substrate-binding protein
VQQRRIVSFLPSATETLYALGIGRQLVGVTHECKFPLEAKRKPRVIHSSFDPACMSSSQINNKIAEIMSSGGDIYIVDDAALKRARPDLIVAQGLCQVCSPFTKEIDRALSVLDNKPDVIVLDPHDLDGILTSILTVAGKVGRKSQGMKLVSCLQSRINKVKATVEKKRRETFGTGRRRSTKKPKVLCIEWVSPFFTAGHWVPQMVEIAGGINGISERGKPSRRMDIDEIVKFDPDIIVLMSCGFDIKRTLKEMSALNSNNVWNSLRAVQTGNLYVVDAGSYFSKPGPRTVTGLEILAKIINPEAFKRLKVPKGSFVKIGKARLASKSRSDRSAKIEA